MIFAGIVAGGCGSRVKSAVIPKQFIEIGGVPVIVRTVRAFLAVEEIDIVYVGIKPDWHEYTNELFERFGIDKERVKVIDGGADRNGTVMNIAEAIVAEHGENEGDIILTHDAVRPFVTEKIIKDNIEAMAKHSACGTYMPAADTIIRSDGEKVRETLNRSELYQAQTPQTFRLGPFVALFNRLLSLESFTSVSQFWEIVFGSKSGLLISTRILPVEGSMATTAPLLSPSAL